MRDFVGNPMNQDQDSENGEADQDRYQTVFTWQIDSTGPLVVQLTPSGRVNEAVTHLQVRSAKLILPTSLTADDLQLTGPTGSG